MQLLLPLPSVNFYEGELVHGSANGDVIDWLHRYPDWPMRCILITGASKSGKSSFAKIFSEKLSGILIYGDSGNFSTPSDLSLGPIVVDDAEKAPEDWLFHLYNHQQVASQPLILLSSNDTQNWECQTRDFASRLTTFFNLLIKEPDDLMVTALLFKQLKQHGIDVGDGELAYASHYIDRSYKAIYDLCERIAKETLRLKKPVTRSLLKEILSQTSIEELEKIDLRQNLLF